MENKIKTRLDNFFKSQGFHKKAKTWFIEKEHRVVLCEYQKSGFSEGFYLNFGLVFKGLSNPPYSMKSHDWHFVGRHNQILGISQSLIEIKSEEHDMEVLLNGITNTICNNILPFLLKVSEIEYLKNNFPDSFPHDKLWIQNIRSNDFKKFIEEIN